MLLPSSGLKATECKDSFSVHFCFSMNLLKLQQFFLPHKHILCRVHWFKSSSRDHQEKNTPVPRKFDKRFKLVAFCYLASGSWQQLVTISHTEVSPLARPNFSPVCDITHAEIKPSNCVNRSQ